MCLFIKKKNIFLILFGTCVSPHTDRESNSVHR